MMDFYDEEWILDFQKAKVKNSICAAVTSELMDSVER